MRVSDRVEHLIAAAYSAFGDVIDALAGAGAGHGLLRGSVADWLRHHHGPILCLIAGLWIAARLRGAIHVPRRPRDPVRSFGQSDVADARGMAGDRCEFTGFVGRCRRQGGHADHWIPWSRGGASSRRNPVWACPRHNLRKGARRPGLIATARISRRRRRYYPPGEARRPGQRWIGAAR